MGGLLPSRSLPTLPRSLSLSARNVLASLNEIAFSRKIIKSQIARLSAAPSDSGYSSEVESNRQDSKQPLDPFERKFTQDWLLLLLKRGDDWIAAGRTRDEEGDAIEEEVNGKIEGEQREAAIEFAAALLSSFAETSGTS